MKEFFVFVTFLSSSWTLQSLAVTQFENAGLISNSTVIDNSSSLEDSEISESSCAKAFLEPGSLNNVYHPVLGVLEISYIGELDLRGEGVLSDKHLAVLSKFISNRGGNINAYLRGSAIYEEDLDLVKSEINILKVALSQLPSWEGVVYRGGFVEQGEWVHLSVGSVFRNYTFMSTSKNYGTAVLFPMDPEPDKVDVSFKIHSKKGRSVYFVHKGEGIDAMGGEFEVLFPPNSQFKVINKLTYGGKNFLELEEI